MSIFQIEPDSPIGNNTESLPTALQESSASLFTPLYPEGAVESLLKYVEGYPWSCNFYGNLVSQSNSLEHFDPKTPNLTQPLYEVKDMVLQVSTPLNSSYEAATGVTASTGSATCPLGVKPNVGDLFIAPMDTGEDAIFVINVVERATYRKSTLYTINYSLYSLLSAEPEFVTRLKARVQQTYYFNKDTNYFNRDVLITPTVKEANDQLKTFMTQSQAYYLQTFSNAAGGTIVVPGTSRTLYDPLLVKFVGGFIDHEIKICHPWYQYVYSDRFMDQKSIWDMILARNPAMETVINKTYSFTSTSQVKGPAKLGNIFHTLVDYMLYPTQPRTVCDVATLDLRGPAEIFTDIHLGSRAYWDIPLQVNHVNADSQTLVTLLPKLFEQDYYVVSAAFYNYLKDGTQVQGVSFVEQLLARFIRKQAIGREDLLRATQRYYEWSPMHQLYWLPVLWLIIRATV